MNPGDLFASEEKYPTGLAGCGTQDRYLDSEVQKSNRPGRVIVAMTLPTDSCTPFSQSLL